MANVVAKKIREELFLSFGLAKVIETDGKTALLPR